MLMRNLRLKMTNGQYTTTEGYFEEHEIGKNGKWIDTRDKEGDKMYVLLAQQERKLL